MDEEDLRTQQELKKPLLADGPGSINGEGQN